MMRMCDPLFAELSEPSLRVSGGIPLSLKLETSEKKHEPSVQITGPTAVTTITTRPETVQKYHPRSFFCNKTYVFILGSDMSS